MKLLSLILILLSPYALSDNIYVNQHGVIIVVDTYDENYIYAGVNEATGSLWIGVGLRWKCDSATADNEMVTLKVHEQFVRFRKSCNKAQNLWQMHPVSEAGREYVLEQLKVLPQVRIGSMHFNAAGFKAALKEQALYFEKSKGAL